MMVTDCFLIGHNSFDLADAPRFVARLLEELARAKLDVSNFEIDHVCYRTDSLDTYERVKHALARDARLLTEAPIRGRPIATYELLTPLRVGARTIPLIEVPAPKVGKRTARGFEHAEFVAGDALFTMVQRLSKLAFDASGMANEGNPELALLLPGGMTAKFHPRSLKDVIKDERWRDVERVDWRSPSAALSMAKNSAALLAALDGAGIFSKLGAHSPIVAGTFPIGVDTKGSDLDILCEAQDLSKFAALLRREFGTLSEFCEASGTSRGTPYVAATFRNHGIPIEIFAQSVASTRQDAFRHMLVEARLLALAGAWAAPAIRALKASGLKTEPAFAQLFGLKDDGYASLLSLDEKPRAAFDLVASAARH